MKNKTGWGDIVIKQENFVSEDLWNNCCCVLSSYADTVDMSAFCSLNLNNKSLNDLENKIMFTANYKQDLVGFLIGGVDLRFSRDATIDWLFLDSDFHRRGIGENLVGKFEYYVRKKYKVNWIEVMSLFSAYGFYQKLGYEHDRREYELMRKYYQH